MAYSSTLAILARMNDDATRAVRAGLEMVAALHELNARLPQPLQVRIGIHTGPVVVGEMGGGERHEQLALGEAPKIAARVQGQAQPDEVVISAATYQLVEGLFECEDRGQPELKGVSTPLTLYRILREGEAQSRFQVVACKGITPLVGREHEHGLSHPFSLCFALVFASIIHLFRREVPQAQEYAEEVKALATEHEFPHWRQYGEMLHGWASAQRGHTEEGIAEIQQGLDGQRAIETELGRTMYLSYLVESYEKAGRPEEGLHALAEALDAVEKRGERYCEADLYRLKGELTLQSKVEGLKSKVEEEAEACFYNALDVARGQEAKSLELRAATSLALLWQQQGKTAEAHDLLAPVYNWFTEGFDTADLQDAKALLDRLS